MPRKIRSYEADAVTIDFDARRCIHAERCVRGLPAVFDAGRRPWIDPAGAGADSIARVVEQCPSGALQYRRSDGNAEAPPRTNTVRVEPDGPLYASGRLRITLPNGEVLSTTRAALCRCGRSEEKPFCDNSHRDGGFRDVALVAESRLKAPEEEMDRALSISPSPDGPILLQGPVHVVGARGEGVHGVSGALCRCGGSSSKPFCDGTHRRNGFAAP